MNKRQIAQEIIEELGLEMGPSMQEDAIASIVRVIEKEFNRIKEDEKSKPCHLPDPKIIFGEESK